MNTDMIFGLLRRNVRQLALITSSLVGGATAWAQPGALDLSFNPNGHCLNAAVSAIAVQSDGKVLVGGAFNGGGRNYVARLHPGGSLDNSFDPGVGPDGGVRAIIQQPDGKYLIGGEFSTYDGIVRNRIARINMDGTLDTSFDPGTGPNFGVYTIVLRPDGKILVGGAFSLWAGTPRNGIAQLNDDGSLDTAFDYDDGTGTAQYSYSIALQPDGKLIIAGLRDIGVTMQPYLCRIAANGSVDATFTEVWAAGTYGIFSTALQSDGKILFAGDFWAVNVTVQGGIGRVNSDGSNDMGFVAGTGTTGQANDIALQPDGRIILVGDLGSYNGTPIPSGVVRLNADGTIDAGFDLGSGVGSGTISTVAVQPDGKILLGGNFGAYDATPRDYLARLLAAPGTAPIQLSARAFLEGPYSATVGLMGDQLRVASLVPLTEPYSSLGYSFAPSGGGETTTSGVLAVAGNDAVVDWVLLELRSNATPSNVVASRAVLLQRDGDVVDLDGVSPVYFTATPAQYHVAVRHRNHLGAMTLNVVALGPTPTLVDLTVPSTATYGTSARKAILGSFPTQALWAGDVTFNNQLKYAGSANDRDPILTAIGGIVPTNTLSGQYRKEDINMNGQVKYAGSANDRDILLQNIGGSVPTAVRNAQLP